MQWDERTKAEVTSVLTLEYTSSDEEDGLELFENTQKRYSLQTLPWESGILKDKKAQLDKCFEDNHATQREKVSLLSLNRGTKESKRVVPHDAPQWVYKVQHD